MTTVVEAFRGLDDERDALRSLAEAQEAATAFLGHYRRYAKVAAKRKAAGPRLTQSRYEGLEQLRQDADRKDTVGVGYADRYSDAVAFVNREDELTALRAFRHHHERACCVSYRDRRK